MSGARHWYNTLFAATDSVLILTKVLMELHKAYLVQGFEIRLIRRKAMADPEPPTEVSRSDEVRVSSPKLALRLVPVSLQ